MTQFTDLIEAESRIVLMKGKEKESKTLVIRYKRGKTSF